MRNRAKHGRQRERADEGEAEGMFGERDAAEVHPEEAGDDRRHDPDGRPRRDLAGVLVLLPLGFGAAGVEGVLEELVHRATALDDVGEGVVDVAEQRDDVGVHPRHALC